MLLLRLRKEKNRILFFMLVPAILSFALLLALSLPALAEQSAQTTAGADKAGAQLESLAARVEKFWQARVIGDEVGAYEFDQAKALGTPTLQDYVSTPRRLGIKKFKVLNTEITGKNTAAAHMKVEIKIADIPKPIEMMIKDPWIFIDGQWYHQTVKRRR